MAEQFTISEKVRIVRLYSVNQSASMTRKELYQEGVTVGKWDNLGLERAPIPSRTTILHVNQVFDETMCRQSIIEILFQA